MILGDRVTVKNGVSLYDALRLEDEVFVGPNVTFTNEQYPKSLQGVPEPLRVIR